MLGLRQACGRYKEGGFDLIIFSPLSGACSLSLLLLLPFMIYQQVELIKMSK